MQVSENLYLVTGSSGFIGFHLCKRLLEDGFEVVGLDNFNNYYSVELKRARTKILNDLSNKLTNNFHLIERDLCDKVSLEEIFKKFKPNKVINLAAQAGVRYSIENPKAYIDTNISGFGNILECCRHYSVKHLVYASSSSVYGGNKIMPFSENQGVDHPVSLYAATKRSNELIAHSYSHIYNLPTTGLRFFTVYGPWGRPDMGYYLFTSKILKGETIKIFNNGRMMRDFTYIDDIVERIAKLVEKTPHKNPNFDYKKPSSSSSWAPFKIFNIGNSDPTNLMEFIRNIEEILGLTAKKEFLPMQDGDVQNTVSDTMLINKLINFKPDTKLVYGINQFVNWYKSYYKIS